MGDFYYLDFGPNDSIKTTSTTLSMLPYFRPLLDGDKKRFFIDRDKEAVHHILEICRNGENYNPPHWIEADWEYFQDTKKTEVEKLVVNVSGEIFWTTRETLMNTNGMLKARLERWDVESDKEIFLDRNPVAFKMVLSLLRNPGYPFPKKIHYELDFYGITLEKDDKACVVSNDDEDSVEFKLAQMDSPHDSNTTGAFLSLGNIGPEDIYLYGNPEITYYAQVYRRSTKSSRTLIEVRPQGTPGIGRRCSFLINRHTDLLSQMFLQVFIEGIENYNFITRKNLIFSLIERVTLEIGGNVIDEFNRDLIYLWMKLYHANEYQLFIEKYGRKYLLLPIHFFFHDQLSVALRLISLQYHEVRFMVEFATSNKIFVDLNNGIPFIDARLIFNGILLDADERRRMAQVGSELRILQHHQYNEYRFQGGRLEVTLNGRHPVIQILIAIQAFDDNERVELFKYNGAQEEDYLINGKLLIGSRIIAEASPFHNLLDRYLSGINGLDDLGVYTISFGPINTDELHSGSVVSTFNFNGSAVDNDAKLDLQMNIDRGIVKVWLFNYNMLRIESGMAAIMYR